MRHSSVEPRTITAIAFLLMASFSFSQESSSSVQQCLSPDVQIESENLLFNLETQTFSGENVQFSIPDLDISGQAELLQKSPQRIEAQQLGFTICASHLSQWTITAENFRLDTSLDEEQVAIFENVKFRLLGVDFPGPKKLIYRGDGSGSTGFLFPQLTGSLGIEQLHIPYFFRFSSQSNLYLAPWLGLQNPSDDNGIEMYFQSKQKSGYIRGQLLQFNTSSLDAGDNSPEVKSASLAQLQFIQQGTWGHLSGLLTDVQDTNRDAANALGLLTQISTDITPHSLTQSLYPNKLQYYFQSKPFSASIRRWGIVNATNEPTDNEKLRLQARYDQTFPILPNKLNLYLNAQSSYIDMHINRPSSVQMRLQNYLSTGAMNWEWRSHGLVANLQAGYDNAHYAMSDIVLLPISEDPLTNSELNDIDSQVKSSWAAISLQMPLQHKGSGMLITPKILVKQVDYQEQNIQNQWLYSGHSLNALNPTDSISWDAAYFPRAGAVALDTSALNLWDISDNAGWNYQHIRNRAIVGIDMYYAKGTHRMQGSIVVGDVNDQAVTAIDYSYSTARWKLYGQLWEQAGQYWQSTAGLDYTYGRFATTMKFINLAIGRGYAFTAYQFIDHKFGTNLGKQWHLDWQIGHDIDTQKTLYSSLKVSKSVGCYRWSLQYSNALTNPHTYNDTLAMYNDSLLVDNTPPDFFLVNENYHIGLALQVPFLKQCG